MGNPSNAVSMGKPPMRFRFVNPHMLVPAVPMVLAVRFVPLVPVAPIVPVLQVVLMVLALLIHPSIGSEQIRQLHLV